MERMTKRELELMEGMVLACSKLERVKTMLEDKQVGKEILDKNRRLDRILDTRQLKDIISRNKRNVIRIRKLDDSTLTRVDRYYTITVKLLNENIPMGHFSFDAAGYEVKDKDEAWRIAEKASETLKLYGIDHELIDETDDE